MTETREPAAGRVGFRMGDIVEVKSKEEILAMLDENGEFESLPFMPEMLNYCGQRIQIYRRANKFCDTAGWTGFHRLDSAVHLKDTRCDGAAHGGCQAGCLLYWKEEWLRPLSEDADATSLTFESPPRQQRRGISESQLSAATRADHNVHGESQEVVYRCQATELVRAASASLPWWNLPAYARDVRAGNATALAMLRSLMVMLFNFFQRANQKFLPRFPLIHGAQKYPFIAGNLSRTPRETLNLQAGERVRVKRREDIIATLDANSRNRGLSFDGEMLKYCGHEARVLRRVDHIIDEQTGRMQKLPNDCIILEGVVCSGDYNRYCPRSIYPYWREIWLERVEQSCTPMAPAMAETEGSPE